LPQLIEGDMTRRQPDIGKMRELLERKPTSIEEGISAIIRAGIFV
jgi:UDP-glucose 4-epimerase